MKGGQTGGILRLSMARIVGFEEAGEDLSLDIDSAVVRQRRAESFRDWLREALPERLRQQVCFVDYTVFQDAKIDNPYFYLVTPTAQTQSHYQDAVNRLVEGTGKEKDCFSVAYHPEFVGIKQDSGMRNSYAIIPVSGERGQSVVAPGVADAVNEQQWVPGLYLLRKGDPDWPPTTTEALNRVCGRHSLKECLEKFKSLLVAEREHICDSRGRPVTFVFSLPFLVSNPLSSRQPDQPFSEIAAALFLGVSFEGTTEQIAAVMEFVRMLALWTYRITGVKKGEQSWKASGEVQGIQQAIETFAHQIKGVANAMSTKWSVSLQRWEGIKSDYEGIPGAAPHLTSARVLPAPELIDAIRETLILWSQTRRIDDLYDLRPACFRDVVIRGWDFTSRIRFAMGHINANLGELSEDLTKVWEQSRLYAKIAITGMVDTPWGDWGAIDLEAEGRLCSVTRLLVAIFDNAAEHGVPGVPPEINVSYDNATQIASIAVYNTVGKNKENVGTAASRLRIGMQGNEVLKYLAEQLNAVLTLPQSVPEEGGVYTVQVEIPSLSIFFSPKQN